MLGKESWGRGAGFTLPAGCSVLPGVHGECGRTLGDCGSPTLVGKAGTDSLPSPALPAG